MAPNKRGHVTFLFIEPIALHLTESFITLDRFSLHEKFFYQTKEQVLIFQDMYFLWSLPITKGP